MKKFLFVITLVAFLVIVVNIKNTATPSTLNEDTAMPLEDTNLITSLDTSDWKRVQIHQKISLQIPQNWETGSDGIYNYNYTKVTGIRDPNFPNNSFKCVFYEDKSLRSKIIVDNELTLNINPKVTLINATWNDNTGSTLRSVGEKFNIYTHTINNTERFIECNIFKGEMLKEDREKLENSILTIQ